MQPIVVVGSVNMDLVVTVPRHPRSGESILGSDYATYPGGKGANQAVAVVRAGGNAQMVGLVGEDAFGAQLQSNLETSGVDALQVNVVLGPSGIALITVDSQGENTIVVSSGANSLLLPDRISPEILQGAKLILMQLEIPLETVQFVTEATATKEIPVLLNAAPAKSLPDQLLQKITYLIVNESEAALLSGVTVQTQDEALIAAEKLRQRGTQTVVVTLGDQGVIWSSPESKGRLPAHRVEVVDTTAAGDAFCGCLATCLAKEMPLDAAVKFANAAGAITVTRQGAQPSLGSQAEIENLLQQGPI